MSGYKRHRPDENLKPYDVHLIENPSQEELREIALQHTPAIYKTLYGNLTRSAKTRPGWPSIPM